MAPESQSPEPLDEAFVLLLSEVQPVLRGYLNNLLPVKSDVDDVLQETNLVLWKKRADYDSRSPFRPWACRFAYFQALSHLKKMTRKKDRTFDPEVLDAIAGEAEKQVDSFEKRTIALQGCMEKLPSKHRGLLDDRYRGNTGVARMAEVAGKSVDALSMTLFRIRKTLRECIERSLAGGES